MHNFKKTLCSLIAINVFLYGSSVYAEIITGAFGGDYWRLTPAKYQIDGVTDPAKEKIKDPFSGRQTINSISINSAILPVSDFTENIKQLKKDCKNTQEYKDFPAHCDDYEAITENTIKRFLLEFSTSTKIAPKTFRLPLRVVSEGINAQKMEVQMDGNAPAYDPVIIYWQGADFIGAKRLEDGSFVGVHKIYGGDSPAYYLFRISVNNTHILFQQTELVPYMNLYAGVASENLENFIKTFDANVKSAIEKGFVFKNKNFVTRYSTIIKNFKQQEKELTRKFDNKSLWKFYKIENNVVRFYSSEVGNPQWLTTDFDPGTVKIFSVNFAAWVDKYGPFVDGMRLSDGDSTFYPLSKDSLGYWVKNGSDLIYTYSKNDGASLTVIPGASVKTMQFKSAKFSSKESLCIPDKNWYVSYDAYDSKYCYGKDANMDGVKVLGKRK